MLMWLSGALRQAWWVLVLALAGLVIGGRALLAHPAGRRAADAGLLRLPGVGKLARSLATARLARLLGSLLRSRVGLIESLQLTRESTGNRLYAELVAEAEAAVAEGRSMSTVLARSPLITPSLAEAVKHGEQSGQVATMLVEMADFMDEDNEAVVRTLTSLLEPVILIALGGMVAFIALSLFMPLFDLTSMT
jgi:type II secretory pathway component PulF